jgi:DNA-binding CsgD family transcriptional regulator
MHELSSDRFSEVVGAICNCALQPDCWPQVIEDICGAIGCRAGSILLLNMKNLRHRRLAGWSDQLFSRECLRSYTTRLWPTPSTGPYSSGPAWPPGMAGAVQAVVARDAEAGSLIVFAASLKECDGRATSREMAILHRLAPHIRHAVTVGDLLYKKDVAAQALTESLNAFEVGLVIVDAEEHVIHANRAAERMFRAGAPICKHYGRLRVCGHEQNRELIDAIAQALEDESEIGASGAAVALSGNCSGTATAHVLPLKLDRGRVWPSSTSAAAVFVRRSDVEQPFDIRAMARCFGLTSAEARLLDYLASGVTVFDAAAAIGIAKSTAKTQLQQIFAKTGVSRQSDLTALVSRLAPRVYAPERPDWGGERGQIF